MSSNHVLLVRGEILFSEELSSFSGATGNVYLEDVSYIDAPSKVVAKQVIPNISHEVGTENRIEFALKGEIPNLSASYSIYVHVSLHKDEQIHPGDYISMESYPVLTFGYPNQITVLVREVTDSRVK
ncbi:MAG: YbaY family lipoprotein [Limnoraphis robusta]|nr:YbaY family lipoprotein [Limnoraphis robusta]MEB3277382.1 YbaY family lipoprotein [Lyngbya sp.]